MDSQHLESLALEGEEDETPTLEVEEDEAHTAEAEVGAALVVLRPMAPDQSEETMRREWRIDSRRSGYEMK